MPKRKPANTVDMEQEQGSLTDVRPANEKEIVATAKRYKAKQRLQMSALEGEVAEKQKLLSLIKEADLQPVDGKIMFTVDGLTITVTPRDELIKVKDDSEGDNDY